MGHGSKNPLDYGGSRDVMVIVGLGLHFTFRACTIMSQKRVILGVLTRRLFNSNEGS